MGPWEVVQNHHQITSNLRYVEVLNCLCIVSFSYILSIVFYYCYYYYQIVFLGIDNIHAMRESFARLREYLDTHGRASSDGRSSFLVSLQILERSSYLCP